MLNRPFSTTNINIFDEKTHNSTPTNFCGQNVLMSQEQHRKIFDSLTTSIAGMNGMQGLNGTPMNGMNRYCPSMQPDFHNPNAVTFMFNPPQPCYQQQPHQAYPWQYQSPGIQTMDQMQQQNAVNLMQLQRQLGTEPHQWKFHLDHQTSTSDLGAKPNASADLSNLAGMLMSKWPYWLQTPMSTNHKKLTLKNVNTAKVEGGICDQLDQNKASERGKKVNFDVPGTATSDFEVQVHLCCQEYDPEKRKKSHRRKRSPKKSRSSESVSSDDPEETHRRSPKNQDRLAD